MFAEQYWIYHCKQVLSRSTPAATCHCSPAVYCSTVFLTSQTTYHFILRSFMESLTKLAQTMPFQIRSQIGPETMAIITGSFLSGKGRFHLFQPISPS